MMMKTIVVLALLGAAIAAPKNTKLGFKNLYKKPIVEVTAPHGRIINGQVAQAHSIPYQAFLEVYDRTGGWYCGGSLISSTVILTAGHCAYQAVQGTVTLGAQKPLQNEDSQITLNAVGFIVHERFDMDNILYDIALIIVRSVSTNQNIQTVPLPSNAGSTYAGEVGKVSGWGLTDGKGDDLSDELRFIENEIISNQECGRIFGTLPDYELCLSGDNNKSVCSGDSGGPLTVGGIQVGIVSYGVEDCTPGYPSGFTRTTSFLDWIKSNSE